jgi:hypothetical protein
MKNKILKLEFSPFWASVFVSAPIYIFFAFKPPIMAIMESIFPPLPLKYSQVEITGKDFPSKQISITSSSLPNQGMIGYLNSSDFAKAKVGDRVCIGIKPSSGFEPADLKIVNKENCDSK